MADICGIEPRTRKCLRFSKPLGEPTPEISMVPPCGLEPPPVKDQIYSLAPESDLV